MGRPAPPPMKHPHGFALNVLACLMALTSTIHAADAPAGAKFQPQLAPRFVAGETFTYQAPDVG